MIFVFFPLVLLVLTHCPFFSYMLGYFFIVVLIVFEKAFAEVLWSPRWTCLPLNRFGCAYVRALLALILWGSLNSFHGSGFSASKRHCEPGLWIYVRADPVSSSFKDFFPPFLLFSPLHLVPGQPFLQKLGERGGIIG